MNECSVHTVHLKTLAEWVVGHSGDDMMTGPKNDLRILQMNDQKDL